MYTLKVKIYFNPAEFNYNDYLSDSGVITMQIPFLPRIGEQIVSPAVLQMADDLLNKEKQRRINWLYADNITPIAFTYINNIVYSEDSTIFIGLSFNTQSYLVRFYDLDQIKRSYYKLVSDIPRALDFIHYPAGYLEKRYRLIDRVYLNDGRTVEARTYDRLQTTFDVDIKDEVNAYIVNTVEIDAPKTISVAIDSRESGQLDVNVRNVVDTRAW